MLSFYIFLKNNHHIKWDWICLYKKYYKTQKHFNNVNTISKYDIIIDNVIAKKLKIKSNNLVFFKNEYDCIKKIIEMLVPKYQEIVSIFPSFEILQLICLLMMWIVYQVMIVLI